MTDAPTMSAHELVRKVLSEDHADLVREGLVFLAQQIMEHEVSAQIGAAHGERSPERVTNRNGYRKRRWDTRAGTPAIEIPKLRSGSYFPSFLEPRTRAEQAPRLRGIDSAEYRLRVGDWRVRFTRDPVARRITVLRVLPRGRV